MNLLWPDGLLHLYLTFICSVVPWTSPSGGRSNLFVSLFHVAPDNNNGGQNTHAHKSNKVQDTEKCWLDRKNKHRGLNLTSAVWTTFPREVRCQLLPRLKLLSSDVWSKMSLLCDHTAAKATLRPWTKMANEPRPGNERSSGKKSFEAILALTFVGVPTKKQHPLNSSFLPAPRLPRVPCSPLCHIPFPLPLPSPSSSASSDDYPRCGLINTLRPDYWTLASLKGSSFRIHV